MFGLKEGKIALRNWKQMQRFRPWFHQVFLRSKIARNALKVCMHGYLSNGYLNSLSNFNFKKAKKITSLRPLLDQPWITTIMKVSMHSYLQNAPINLWLNFSFEKLFKRENSSNEHPNLWSNFNSEKLVRSETSPFIFARVGLEWVQIAWTITQVGMHVFISNGHPNMFGITPDSFLFHWHIIRLYISCGGWEPAFSPSYATTHIPIYLFIYNI